MNIRIPSILKMDTNSTVAKYKLKYYIYNDAKTTMIHTYVLNHGRKGMRGPIDSI